jgi:hypothetical protein
VKGKRGGIMETLRHQNAATITILSERSNRNDGMRGPLVSGRGYTKAATFFKITFCTAQNRVFVVTE